MGAEDTASDTGHFLVPLGESSTLRQTVGYVAGEALAATAAPGSVEIHFVYVSPWHRDDPGIDTRDARATRLLERARTWAEFDLQDADEAAEITLHTAVIGNDRYLFGPTDYADALLAYAALHELDRIVIDPEYAPSGAPRLLQPLEFELSRANVTVEEAPVDRPARHTRVARRVTRARFLATFALSFAFYLVLGDPTDAFDLLTGGATATLTAVILSAVTFTREPTWTQSPIRLLRMTVYIPYLLYEIVKANIEVAAVILHPRLPIEPRMTRVQSRVGPGLPITTLANSITLTPGTLTVRARDRDLFVHTLLPTSRAGLFDGSLERWVRFVFYGRSGARAATPRERGDTAILQGEEADEPLFPGEEHPVTEIAGGQAGREPNDPDGGAGE